MFSSTEIVSRVNVLSKELHDLDRRLTNELRIQEFAQGADDFGALYNKVLDSLEDMGAYRLAQLDRHAREQFTMDLVKTWARDPSNGFNVAISNIMARLKDIESSGAGVTIFYPPTNWTNVQITGLQEHTKLNGTWVTPTGSHIEGTQYAAAAAVGIYRSEFVIDVDTDHATVANPDHNGRRVRYPRRKFDPLQEIKTYEPLFFANDNPLDSNASAYMGAVDENGAPMAGTYPTGVRFWWDTGQNYEYIGKVSVVGMTATIQYVDDVNADRHFVFGAQAPQATTIRFINTSHRINTINGGGTETTSLCFEVDLPLPLDIGAGINPVYHNNLEPSDPMNGIRIAAIGGSWLNRAIVLNVFGTVAYTAVTDIAGLPPPVGIQIDELATIDEHLDKLDQDVTRLKLAAAQRQAEEWFSWLDKGSGFLMTVAMVSGTLSNKVFAVAGVMQLVAEAGRMSSRQHVDIMTAIINSSSAAALLIGGIHGSYTARAQTTEHSSAVVGLVNEGASIDAAQRFSENMRLIKKYPAALDVDVALGGETYLHYTDIKAQNVAANAGLLGKVGVRVSSLLGKITRKFSTNAEIMNRTNQPVHGSLERREYREVKDSGNNDVLIRDLRVTGWGENTTSPKSSTFGTEGVIQVVSKEAKFGEHRIIQKFQNGKWVRDDFIMARELGLTEAEAAQSYGTSGARFDELHADTARTIRMNAHDFKMSPSDGSDFLNIYERNVSAYSLFDKNCNLLVKEYREFMSTGKFPGWWTETARRSWRERVYNRHVTNMNVADPPAINVDPPIIDLN
jgi:hypothetical protein